MSYDDVLPYLSRGNFGKYQKKIYFLLCLPSVLCAFHKLAGVFLLDVPNHRCLLKHESLANASFKLPEDVWSSHFPFDETKNEYSKCEIFGKTANETEKCSEFVWDTNGIETSAVKSFNLICDRATLRASADSMMMIGVLIGSYIFGDLSDRFGRKPTFILALVIQVVFGLLTAIAPDFITYTICRMIVGSTASGVILVSYCLSLELVNKESRLYAGTVVMFFFSAGYILIGAFAYFLHDWRWLQAALTIPGLFFVSYWFLVPESVRWLLANNKKDEAVTLIKRVAKANKLTVPEEVMKSLNAEMKTDGHKPSSLLDLFKHPNLRNKTLLIFFNWFVISGAYYGLSWSTSSLGGNKLVNFVISGAVEFPAVYFLILTLNRWGRKIILAGSMLFSGATLLLSLVIPASQNWLIVGLTMFGKMSITASYGVLYVFSAEQFPTVIRNVALGAASMSARIGGIAAPYLNFLAQFWKPAPFFIFGFTVLIGGMLSMLLPETYNTELPETIADGENFGIPKKKSNETEALNVQRG